jgi:hypothetical protein
VNDDGRLWALGAVGVVAAAGLVRGSRAVARTWTPEMAQGRYEYLMQHAKRVRNEMGQEIRPMVSLLLQDSHGAPAEEIAALPPVPGEVHARIIRELVLQFHPDYVLYLNEGWMRFYAEDQEITSPSESPNRMEVVMAVLSGPEGDQIRTAPVLRGVLQDFGKQSVEFGGNMANLIGRIGG